MQIRTANSALVRLTAGLAVSVTALATHSAFADNVTSGNIQSTQSSSSVPFTKSSTAAMTLSPVALTANNAAPLLNANGGVAALTTTIDRSGVRKTVQAGGNQAAQDDGVNAAATLANATDGGMQSAVLGQSASLNAAGVASAQAATQGAIRGPSSADLAAAGDARPSFLAGVASKAGDVVDGALNLIGVHYRWGGSSPDSGLDCSGFVRYVFQDALGFTLPRRAEEMSRVGEKVAVNDLKPGDLVFFNTMRRTISHVGIYIGNNQFVHSPSTGSSIRVDNMEDKYWYTRYRGARRVDLPDGSDAGTDIATRLQQASHVAY